MKEKTNKYQFILVFNPKLESEVLEKIVKKVASFLDEKGAKIDKKDAQGLKDLAYEVKGFRKGNFLVMDVSAGKPVKLSELNLFLNRENNVIRYLILRN